MDDAGFRKVGEWVVDHCDVLLALWDGQPPPRSGPAGAPPGTAAIVGYALSHPREIPVIVVPVARGQRGDEPAQEALPPRQLLLRTEHANPFVDLRWRALGGQGNEPTGLSPRLTDQLDRVPTMGPGRAGQPGRARTQERIRAVDPVLAAGRRRWPDAAAECPRRNHSAHQAL